MHLDNPPPCDRGRHSKKKTDQRRRPPRGREVDALLLGAWPTLGGRRRQKQGGLGRWGKRGRSCCRRPACGPRRGAKRGHLSPALVASPRLRREGRVAPPRPRLRTEDARTGSVAENFREHIQELLRVKVAQRVLLFSFPPPRRRHWGAGRAGHRAQSGTRGRRSLAPADARPRSLPPSATAAPVACHKH